MSETLERVTRIYGEAERARGLAAIEEAGSYSGASRLVGIPSGTLHHWAHTDEDWSEAYKRGKELRRERLEIWQRLEREGLSRTLAQVDQLTGPQAAIVAGIAADKIERLTAAELADGQPGQAGKEAASILADVHRLRLTRTTVTEVAEIDNTSPETLSEYHLW